MKRWAFLLLILSVSLFSSEGPFDFSASREQVLDNRENFFLTTTDYPITPRVNPITGEYSEEEVDLVVAGSEPLSIHRCKTIILMIANVSRPLPI